MRSSAKLAVDIGGTFTDVVLAAPDGKVLSSKLLTTHQAPHEAVLAGIESLLQDSGLPAGAIDLIIHGTTLATNALIERRGANTALLTTAGHRDVLELAHEDRFEQYDINMQRPAPLVPRDLRLPIPERMDVHGRILLPLDLKAIEACLPALDAAEVRSVAIGYLHAYANPEHEQRSAEHLHRLRPDLALTLASEVCPEIREYERLSTACANAYVQPLMATYLGRLATQLAGRGLTCPLLLMTSGGGLTTLETARRFPIRLVESGPAGGAILAQDLARRDRRRHLLSFDMGGTTAKLCLIDDFQALHSRSFEVDRRYRFKKGSGLPIRIPVIEMVEIGAGGGSLARVDKLGRLQVGPQSAGSEPGPAAYGRGGDRPAVTDADLQLGRIVTAAFANGALRLDQAASQAALLQHVARPLTLDADAAALAVSEVVDETMAAAARAHAAEFGLALAERDMIAFGGAAPLHATRLAEKLGVRRIIIPAHAGVGSALGFLLAPIAFEVVRSRPQTLSGLELDNLQELFEQMQAEALAVVRQAAPKAELNMRCQAYMRYRGQGHELALDLPQDFHQHPDREVLRRLFEAEYTRLYSRPISGVEIEIMSWTLNLASLAPDQTVSRGTLGERCLPSPAQQQSLLLCDTGERRMVPIYQRAELQPGDRIAGPALISEAQTTTVLGQTWRARLDADGSIILERDDEADQ